MGQSPRFRPRRLREVRGLSPGFGHSIQGGSGGFAPRFGRLGKVRLG